MSQSEKPYRFYTRSDIREVELSEDRESQLRQAFEQTEPADRTNQRLAATFEIDGEISDSGVVVSTRLHADRIFDLVASSARPSNNDENEIIASATVKDLETEKHLSAHVSQQELLISRKTDDVDFEMFRDYVLYLESELHVTLNPIVS
jgi:hypothetical protein